MDTIAQVDYKRVPVNALRADVRGGIGDVDASVPTTFIVAAWFRGKPETVAYGAFLDEAIADLFRMNDKS